MTIFPEANDRYPPYPHIYADPLKYPQYYESPNTKVCIQHDFINVYKTIKYYIKITV